MALTIGKTYFIKNVQTGLYLNVYGNDTVSNGRNVCLSSKEECLAQKWVITIHSNGALVKTTINQNYGLNINLNDSNNCSMWPVTGNDEDAVVDFLTINASQNLYKIKMFAHNKFLRPTGTVNLANVYWSDSVDDDTLWQLEESESFTADSLLVSKVIPAHANNFTKNRSSENSLIEKITIHHVAGNLSIEALGAIWQNPNRNGSSHYGINGKYVGQFVKEKDIAWTDGNWDSNKKSVTIETANSTGEPTWEVSAESLHTLIRLIADIAKRNNFGTLVKGVNVTWHSMYSATACPGPYILTQMDYIVAEANKLI